MSRSNVVLRPIARATPGGRFASLSGRFLLVLPALLLVACPAPPEQPAKYPPKKEGCEIRVFPDRPSYNVDNIGPVSATCDESIADADCLRTLEDQACKLGGDTVWGVADKPEMRNGKKWLNGRAAHQK